MKRIISAMLVVVAVLLTTSLALAQSGTKVTLQQVEATDNTITVDVMVEDVADLYGAEFHVRYDPAVLAVQDLNPEQDGLQIKVGTLLPADQGFVVANKVVEAEGKIVFAMTLLNPAPPVNGSGPLARVSFKVLQSSPSEISVDHAKLVAANLQTIPSQTGSLPVGGQDQGASVTAPQATEIPAAPAATSDFPWWIVAVMVMLLGVLALAGLIVFGSRKPPYDASATSKRQQRPGAHPPRVQPQQPPRQPVRPSGSRPSAFKQNPSVPPDLVQKSQ